MSAAFVVLRVAATAIGQSRREAGGRRDCRKRCSFRSDAGNSDGGVRMDEDDYRREAATEIERWRDQKPPRVIP